MVYERLLNALAQLERETAAAGEALPDGQWIVSVSGGKASINVNRVANLATTPPPVVEPVPPRPRK